MYLSEKAKKKLGKWVFDWRNDFILKISPIIDEDGKVIFKIFTETKGDINEKFWLSEEELLVKIIDYEKTGCKLKEPWIDPKYDVESTDFNCANWMEKTI